MTHHDDIHRRGSPEHIVEYELDELPSLEAFIKSALLDILPDDLTDNQYRRVFQLLPDCDILFIDEDTQTNYLYYRYRHHFADEGGDMTAIKYYIVREQSPAGTAWYGAPKHEVAVDMEYMPLPGNEEAENCPFTYQDLETPGQIVDFIEKQSQHVDEAVKNHEL